MKNRRRMLYFPMDFGELTIDGLIDTGSISSSIPEMDLRKIRLLAPRTNLNAAPPPDFQIKFFTSVQKNVSFLTFMKHFCRSSFSKTLLSIGRNYLCFLLIPAIQTLFLPTPLGFKFSFQCFPVDPVLAEQVRFLQDSCCPTTHTPIQVYQELLSQILLNFPRQKNAILVPFLKS